MEDKEIFNQAEMKSRTEGGDILRKGRDMREPRTCSGCWSIQPHERKVGDEASEVAWLARWGGL